VYFAESATEFPLVDCVVTIDQCSRRSFRLSPDRLAPKTAQGLGSSLGRAVKVATIVAVPPAGDAGWRRESQRKTAGDGHHEQEICFEGSATLCAVSVALAGEGRLRGAV